MMAARYRGAPVGLEATSLLAERPTGICVCGRALASALQQRSPGHYWLLCRWSKWRARRRFNIAPWRPYVSGGSLSTRVSLLHSLDTRIPRKYRGLLVVNIFDTLSAMPISEEMEFSSREFRAKKLRAYREIALRADAVVTLSTAVAQQFQSRFETRARVLVIPPGAGGPLSLPSREEAVEILRRRGVEPPFLLSVGALCPRKNVELAVRVTASLRRDFPRLRLVLAGEPAYGWRGSPGEEAVRGESEAVAALGYLPRDELWAAYMAAEAVVHLSHYEGFGMTVLEALRAGTPVVASRRGGIPEAAGGAAWLVDPGDPGEVEASVRAVLEGGALVEGRRRLGLEHARRLTWERAAAKVEELYHELLRERL
jgi:glycosyltransferase involved in cell wall biosynthesis